MSCEVTEAKASVFDDVSLLECDTVEDPVALWTMACKVSEGSASEGSSICC